MGVDVQQEQWIIIKFLVAEGVESADIYFRLSVEFKSETLSHSTVFEWCARVHSRRQSTDDDIRVEAPRTAIMDQNIRQAEACIIADRRVMVCEIAEKFSLSFESVETVIHEHLKFFQVSPNLTPNGPQSNWLMNTSSIELMPVSLLSRSIEKNKMNSESHYYLR